MDLAATRRTRRLYSCLSCWNSLAASGLAGDPQLGSVRSDCMEVRMVHTLWQGDHLSWIMSKHMDPSLQQHQL